MEGYPHKTKIQIRFKDTDAMGHVNNANHFTYIEYARVEYANAVLGNNINWNKLGFIMAKISIDYKIPILLKDNVFVYTKCSRIGTKSFDFKSLIVKEENGIDIELASATAVLVCFDYETQLSKNIPEEWKNKLVEDKTTSH